MQSNPASAHKIVVVEDDEVLSKLMTKGLVAAGFQAKQAFNGKDGLKMIVEEKPSLVLLDISMPDMDGLTMLELLRKDPAGAKIPVIILSNFDDTNNVAKSVAYGVRFYLLKVKLTVEEVIVKIKEVLNIVE